MLQVEQTKAEQATLPLAKLLPIPAGIPHQQPRAITAEEKSQKSAYGTLRKSWSDARHDGARKAKKAKKDAAAAEKSK